MEDDKFRDMLAEFDQDIRALADVTQPVRTYTAEEIHGRVADMPTRHGPPDGEINGRYFQGYERALCDVLILLGDLP